MSRPKKCRKVCHLPRTREFYPAGAAPEPHSTVVMTVDEYESVRLIDYEGFSQEECGAYMRIARTTVQLIYNHARKKLADAIVNGTALRIEGGYYRLCDGKEHSCACGGCEKHRCSSRNADNPPAESPLKKENTHENCSHL